MSYEINIYAREFLRRAIEQQLGDWTDADPIASDCVRALESRVLAAGFVALPHDPSFEQFLRECGDEPSKDFQIDTVEYLAQLSIFTGQIAFSVPNSDRAEASIRMCTDLAKRLTAEHGLGFWDPQSGTAEY